MKRFPRFLSFLLSPVGLVLVVLLVVLGFWARSYLRSLVLP